MTHPHTTLDRLRIERAAWTLDARLQDLPRKSRIAKRRELRDNLRAAAGQVGARQAVRQLGDLRTLAAGYRAAEYEDPARRPSWGAATLFVLGLPAFMLAVGYVATSAFHAGVAATAAHPSGTFHWHGVSYLISPQNFTYLNGHRSSTGGAWTPLAYTLMLAGAVIAGRLWRLLPARPDRHILDTAENNAAQR